MSMTRWFRLPRNWREMSFSSRTKPALPDALRAHSSSLLTDLTAQDLLILEDTLEFLADRAAAIRTEALPGGWDGEHYTLTDDSHAAVQTLFIISAKL